MRGRAVLILLTSVACARGSDWRPEREIGPIAERDASADAAAPVDRDGSLASPSDDAGRGCADTTCADAAVTADAGMTPVPDAAPPRTVEASFKVRQVNAALQQPVVTDLQLEVGDYLTLEADGNIWPGLVAQGCNGPDGTSGKHTDADWPLAGGPDFALVAFVNGSWVFVGSRRELIVSEPGLLRLGTNDNDHRTGDDCTSVEGDQQGFNVRVKVSAQSG